MSYRVDPFSKMSDSDSNEDQSDRRPYGSDSEDEDGADDVGGGAFMSLLNSYYDAPTTEGVDIDSASPTAGADGSHGSPHGSPQKNQPNSPVGAEGSDNIDTKKGGSRS